MSHAAPPLRILWVGTRSPWPPHDGGRLVAALTIEALADAGAEVLLVTPEGPTPPPPHPRVTAYPCVEPRASWPRAAVRAVVQRQPLTVTRHLMPAVRARVVTLLTSTRVDVVHVEQLQALDAARAAKATRHPLLLRLHNVESALWRQGGGRPAVWRPLLRAEGRRLAAHEARVMADVETVVTLSTADASAARTAAPSAHVVHVPPPAPLSPPALAHARLDGAPACVWLGSQGWAPNDDGRRWLQEAIWPAVRASVPGARLHVFGPPTVPATQDVHWHPAPAHSAQALAPDTVLLLPLRLAAGVRMRVRDAWVQGVPIVATPAALEGLETAEGHDVLVARTPTAFADAVQRLAHDHALRTRLVEGGRARIATHHTPARVAERLLALYADAAARRARL